MKDGVLRELDVNTRDLVELSAVRGGELVGFDVTGTEVDVLVGRLDGDELIHFESLGTVDLAHKIDDLEGDSYIAENGCITVTDSRGHGAIITSSNGSISEVRSWPRDLVVGPQEYLAFADDKWVVVVEDQGVLGKYVRVFSMAENWSRIIVDGFRCHFMAASASCIFLGVQQDALIGGAQIFGFSFSGDMESWDVPGVLCQLVSDGTKLLAGVFNGFDEVIIDYGMGGGKGDVLDLPVGKKSISLDGSLISIQGHSDGVLVYSVGQCCLRSDDRVQNTDTEASRFVLSHGSSTQRRVLHFHGGPESFEVAESRMFGLPQLVASLGMQWIGINYPGSQWPDPAYTRRAWHAWRDSVVPLVSDALRGVDGPVLVVGWSFGAALALAVANLLPPKSQIVIGGVPGPIAGQALRASELDENHLRWFETRFEVDGDDGNFLNGVSGFNPAVTVTAFHGIQDTNCPYDLAKVVSDSWARLGNPWKWNDLPSGEHYISSSWDLDTFASGIADALLDPEMGPLDEELIRQWSRIS